MFVGDVSDEWRSRVREEMGRVVAFYAGRYDLVVPEFTLYFSTELEPVAARYHKLHGRDSPLRPGFGGGWVAGDRGEPLEAFVTTNSRGSLLGKILPHEYYHLMQYHVLRTHADGGRVSPAWLIEGTARYGEVLYQEQYAGADAEFLWRWEPLARSERPFTYVMRNESPFSELSLGGVINASLESHLYTFAASAVGWLVANSGREVADLEYWRALAETDDSDNAFASAFGITVDDFVEAFEAYRADVAQDQPRIGGLIVDFEGVPLAGVHIGVSPKSEGALAAGISGEDGRFAITVLPEWVYFLTLGRVVGGSQFAGVFYGLSVDPRTGYANICAYGALPVGQESVEDLVLKVQPELLSRPDEPACNEGVPGYHKLAMRFFGPDGESIRGREVYGVVTPAERLRGGVQGGWAAGIGPDGVASRIVAEGSYAVHVFLQSGDRSWAIGWYGGETGFTTSRDQATVIEVTGADVTDIEIHLPADPADLP